MSSSPRYGNDPKDKQQEEEIVFEEIVCAAEFPEGCIVPDSVDSSQQ